MEKKYNNITEKDIQDILDTLHVQQNKDRKFVCFTVDKKDGVFKNLIETQQFDEAIKREVNKFLDNV